LEEKKMVKAIAVFSLLVSMPGMAAKKVFLVDKTYQAGSATTYNATQYNSVTNGSAQEMSYTPKIMHAFEKCPEVTFTTEKSNADFVLNPQPKGSILSLGSGDVVYISPAVALHNMVKDVCGYIKSHP
jgi:hypothetical protein